MENALIFVGAILLFWAAPIFTCWQLSENQGKDPLGPILGAVFFSWAGGLIIWALIKADPERIDRYRLHGTSFDPKSAEQQDQPQQIDPKRREELEKLLIAPKK